MNRDSHYQILKFIKSLIIKAMQSWHMEKMEQKKNSRNRAKSEWVAVTSQDRRENGASAAKKFRK